MLFTAVHAFSIHFGQCDYSLVPSPAHCFRLHFGGTASDKKLGGGLGTRLQCGMCVLCKIMCVA